VNRTVLVALGVILLAAGLGVSYAQWASGGQPWGQLLGDNFLLREPCRSPSGSASWSAIGKLLALFQAHKGAQLIAQSEGSP